MIEIIGDLSSIHQHPDNRHRGISDLVLGEIAVDVRQHPAADGLGALISFFGIHRAGCQSIHNEGILFIR